jgi:general L-amino acid transport system permease protein
VAAWALWRNTAEALSARQIRSGFGFLAQPAGFDIGEGPVPYTPRDSYLLAFAAGLANTLRVSAAGIVLATLLGTLVGVGRLSRNALVRAACTAYVEVLRNLPLVLLLLGCYLAATELLPAAAEPLALPGGGWLSKGGLQVPRPIWAPGWTAALLGLPAGLLGALALHRWARRRRARTGRAPAVAWPALGLVLLVPGLGWLLGGAPHALERPEVGPFGVSGGLSLTPEFLALLTGLTLSAAAAIAEIVRSGLLAVAHGQLEAAQALGLSRRQAVRLVLLPQALRLIVPPLTSQFLNLTKNSSLAVAIGYPDVVSIANTAINQNGQALECILVIMAVYLLVNLVTAAGMNLYDRRVALVER